MAFVVSSGVDVDVQYAVEQLERARRKQWTGQGCVDELSRCLDALERVQEALKPLPATGLGGLVGHLGELYLGFGDVGVVDISGQEAYDVLPCMFYPADDESCIGFDSTVVAE